MRNRRVRRAVTLVLLLSFAACSKKPTERKPDKDQVTEKPPPATLEDFDPLSDRSPSKMDIVLTDGKALDEAAGQIPVAPTTRLSRQQTDTVLARLPDLNAQPDDTATFAKRAKSLPPPRTGDTVETAFPPDGDRERPASVDVKDVPLEVIRFQPEGETPIAPHISVTFNKPMVTIASHADTIAENVPVSIEPQPEGQWRWVGAKTLLFEPTGGRFPMATEYTVQVPAGTKSANGETLPKTKSWTFGTPPVTVENQFPTYGTHGLDQVIYLQFNQKIDPEKIVEHVHLKTGGIFGRMAVRRAEPETVDADPQIKQLVENAEPDRWVAVRGIEDLPYDANIQVVVEKGTPSAEGPRTTPNDHTFGFRTYGPLKVTQHRCGYNQCSPTDSFSFQLSNQLDAEAFDPSQLTIEPSFPAMNIQQYGQWIHVYGQKPGRRTYTVTLDREISDEFGQNLTGRNEFEFEVGPSTPQMYSTANVMNVLDPSADPTFSVFSINYAKFRVRAWKVEPSDWSDYLAYVRDWRYSGKHQVKPPGKLVLDEQRSIDARPDDLVQTDIGLSEYLGESNRGNLILWVTPTKTTKGSTMPQYPPQVRTWAQATEIGLDAYVDSDEFMAWTTSLDDGEPLGDTRVELVVSGQKAKSNDEGIARFDLVPWKDSFRHHANLLLATRDGDQAFLPEQMWGGRQNTTWVERETPDSLAWFVYDDRGMYKPGETVTVNGWLRAIENREQGMVRMATGKLDLKWTVTGPQGNEITSGTADTTELGGFDFEFDLPDTPNLGQARIQIEASANETNSTYYHTFQIQEFRTPEFEVTTSAPEGPHFATESAVVSVEAKYYSGGPLPGADVNWNVTATVGSYTPPNQSEYTFGSWTPWWASYNNPTGQTTSVAHSSKTDAAGVHDLKMTFGDITPPRPMSVRAQATVMDVNRQAWTSTTNLLVHPSEYYVGLKTETYFVEKGEPLEVQVVVSDIDGNLVADRPVKVRASRTKYTWSNGTYEEEEVDPQDCEIETKEGPATCTFQTKVGGTYRIVATTTDDYGRLNFTEFTRWVSGGKRPVARRVEQEEVQLIPDRDEYQPGDTAELLVQSPIVPAEAVLTLQRNGMVEERRFTMSEPTTTLNVPIKNTHMPNLRVQVDVVGSQARLDENGDEDESLPRRPAYGSGGITLKVPPHDRRLSLTVAPESDRVSPAADTSVDVEVRDAAGKPVANAELAVVVVDEAILALSSYQMADPIETFYPQRPAGVREHHLRGMVSLADPSALRQNQQHSPPMEKAKSDKKAERTLGLERDSSAIMLDEVAAEPAPTKPAPMDAPMSGMLAKDGADTGGNASTPIAVRTNFDPLAAFASGVKTNAAGKATIDVKMPDNLTRYRIMVVAVTPKRFGTAESNVTARLPLMVRPSAPRFLNFGDQFDLPVVLQNQTDEPMTVHVAARGTNVEFEQALGWKVQVPADDRVEVRFPASTAMAGTARFQVGAAAGPHADAAEFSLPVWTPATSEAFATYGVIDDGAVVQPVSAPTDVWPQFGGLEVTTSSTALQALTDAFIYLYDYEYQCAEQISSRMVSVAALRDVLSAFQAEGMPSKQAVQSSMKRDIDELTGRQNGDGGFGLWRRGQPSWPYVSIHASHALTRAKQKGYEVPQYSLDRAKNYLQNIERYIPGWWPQWIRLHAIAYSLYVRTVMGDRDPAKAREVIRRGGKLENISFESVGWLLLTMTGQKGYQKDTAEIRRFLNNRVTETAAGAHFAARTDDDDYVIMRSDRVADGVILEALIEDQPKSDLIPKIVNGLLAHRKKGRWGNTQENAFILLALDRYFNTFEKQTPNFVARIWLGDRYAGEHQFKGRTTERHHVDVPMKYLVEKSKKNLYLQKDGKGRMYYRIGMDYAPKSLVLDPADHGFVVERAYEPVDSDDDVRRRNDGTWEIKAGAKVRVKLTMVAPTRRYHVALVDPLPAGLESMNPALAVTGDIPQNQAHNTGRSGTWGWWWWTRPWFEHQNMRDERTEAFTTLLWGGVHTYTYYARATTPGNFVVPPTKAEEMYHPETFGRSSSDRVVVVD